MHTARIHVSSDGSPTEDERLSGLVATARSLARLREGRCAVSATALRPLRNLFAFESVGEGKDPAIPIQAALVKEARGPAETFGRFVGRKDELRTIGEVLASSTRRSGRALTIRGDHGVGKTRLLYEVERRLRKGNYNVGFYLCTCPPRGKELPLSGIAAMLQTLCGVAEGDANERIVAVQPRLRALGLRDDEVGAVLQALGATLPRRLADAKGPLRNAFARMALSLCDDRPHLFAWDAAHAMDADSFLVLESVFQPPAERARRLRVRGARGVHPSAREARLARGGGARGSRRRVGRAAGRAAPRGGAGAGGAGPLRSRARGGASRSSSKR